MKNSKKLSNARSKIEMLEIENKNLKEELRLEKEVKDLGKRLDALAELYRTQENKVINSLYWYEKEIEDLKTIMKKIENGN